MTTPEVTECQGTWQERSNPEAPELPLFVCDGCGEAQVLKDGRMITVRPAKEA